MINVKGLKKKFNELTVLNGIDIVVEQGQVSGDVFRWPARNRIALKKGRMIP